MKRIEKENADRMAAEKHLSGSVKGCELTFDELERNRLKAVSALGWVHDDNSVSLCGHDLHKDLTGRIDAVECLYLFIKRKLPSREIVEILNTLIIATGYPDIRIWPNRAVAHSAAAGASLAAGIGSGMLGMEGKMFGVGSLKGAYNFLVSVEKALDKGGNLRQFLASWLEAGKTAYGFGRPLLGKDERVSVVLDAFQKAGLKHGKAFRLISEIDSHLFELKKLRMNFTGITTAILRDLDFSFDDALAFATSISIPSFIGIFREHSSNYSPVFPFACTDIDYVAPE